MKEDSEKTIQSPEQLADHLRVTYVPTYLLAACLGHATDGFYSMGHLRQRE